MSTRSTSLFSQTKKSSQFLTPYISKRPFRPVHQVSLVTFEKTQSHANYLQNTLELFNQYSGCVDQTSNDSCGELSQDPTYVQILLPLRNNGAKYLDNNGQVNVGTIFEAMDSVVSHCQQLHRQHNDLFGLDRISVLPGFRPTTQITSTDFSDAVFSQTEDVLLEGRISNVDKQTYETTLTASQNDRILLETKFIVGEMVSTDSLSAEFSFDSSLFHGDVPMSSTEQEQVLSTCGKHVNVYRLIHAGYLLAENLRLAQKSADRFSQGSAQLKVLENANFSKLVPIGSQLRNRAVVAATNDYHMQVSSISEVFCMETQKFEVACQFEFVFEADQKLPSVFPTNLDEMKIARRGQLNLASKALTLGNAEDSDCIHYI